MTVIRNNSISGINSITAQSDALNFYDSTGNTLSIGASVSGNITGDVTGNLTGNVTGNLTVATGATISGSTNTIIASTNGSERVRIHSSGKVGINTDDFARDHILTIAESSSSGTLAGILINDTDGKEFSIRSSSNGLRFRDSTDGNDRLTIDTNGNVAIVGGNLVFSTSGAGIDFSANSNAAGMTSELLDDYEEGTWTCSFNGVIGNTTGYYTKIGNLVHIQVYGSGLNVQFAVPAQIGGLPFTVRSSYSVGAANHNTYTTNGDNFYFSINNTVALFYQENTITQANVNVGNPRYVMMAGSYITD